MIRARDLASNVTALILPPRSAWSRWQRLALGAKDFEIIALQTEIDRRSARL